MNKINNALNATLQTMDRLSDIANEMDKILEKTDRSDCEQLQDMYDELSESVDSIFQLLYD